MKPFQGLSELDTLTEERARELEICIGCGMKKSSEGLVVCWDCFKRTTNKVPFKHYYGDIKQWANTHSYLKDIKIN